MWNSYNPNVTTNSSCAAWCRNNRVTNDLKKPIKSSRGDSCIRRFKQLTDSETDSVTVGTVLISGPWLWVQSTRRIPAQTSTVTRRDKEQLVYILWRFIASSTSKHNSNVQPGRAYFNYNERPSALHLNRGTFEIKHKYGYFWVKTTVLCCCLYLSWQHVSALALGHLQVIRYIIEETIQSEL